MWECQFNDSELTHVLQQGGTCVLRFSALCARPVPPGDSAVGDWGYALGVDIGLPQLASGAWSPGAMGRIAEGRLEQGGERVKTWMLPGHHEGPTVLRLRFANGALLVVEALGWRSQFVDGPRFRESYAC